MSRILGQQLLRQQRAVGPPGDDIGERAAAIDPELPRARFFGCRRPNQSSGSTLTIRWSWLLPTQNVTGVVELSTNTVRMLVSEGIRYCTVPAVFGSSRTTRSVCIVDAQISPFLSKLARYGYVRAGSSYDVNCSDR